MDRSPNRLNNVSVAERMGITEHERRQFVVEEAARLLELSRGGSRLVDKNPDYGPYSWLDEGLCAQTDPDSFVPEKNESIAAPLKICSYCDVAASCLAYAIKNKERFGVWGGFSVKERAKIGQNLLKGIVELPHIKNLEESVDVVARPEKADPQEYLTAKAIAILLGRDDDWVFPRIALIQAEPRILLDASGKPANHYRFEVYEHLKKISEEEFAIPLMEEGRISLTDMHTITGRSKYWLSSRLTRAGVVPELRRMHNNRVIQTFSLEDIKVVNSFPERFSRWDHATPNESS